MGMGVPTLIDVPQSSQLLSMPADEVKEIGLPLYRAALKGDWEASKRILDKHPDAISARVSVMDDYTVLQVAAASGHTNFVKNLIARMTNEDLALHGLTTLQLAVMSGNIDIAKLLVEKDYSLVGPRGSRLDIVLRTPINLATLYGRHEMVRFLYQSTNVFDDSQLQTEDRNALFVNSVSKGIYDIALDMLKRKQELASARDCKNLTALHAMALKPLGTPKYPNRIQQGIWCRFINTSISLFRDKTSEEELRQRTEFELLESLWKQVNASMTVSEIEELLTRPWPLLFSAAKRGNVMLLTIVLDSFPDLILMVDDHGLSLFHAAITSRQEEIFKFLCKFRSFKDIAASKVDCEGNNLLHHAALLPSHRPCIVSGAALELQRELLWFEEVKSLVPPNYKEDTNCRGKTPAEVFKDEHKILLEQGKKWVKETANSCILVATLITAMVFAVSFIVTGEKTHEGTLIHREKFSFKVFSILDTISLIFSSTSILSFLSILTVGYKEEDFMWYLPSKLILGLLTLYISIILMMGVFGATFFIILEEGIIGLTLAAATCIPVMWYVLMLRHVFQFSFMFGSLLWSNVNT